VTNMEKLLSPEELGELLNVSIHTIYQWTSKRHIPYIKVGKLVRFDTHEILEWLDTNTRKPESALLQKVGKHGKNISAR